MRIQKPVNYFRKKAPSQMFDLVLNTSLQLVNNNWAHLYSVEQRIFSLENNCRVFDNDKFFRKLSNANIFFVVT